VPLPVLAMSEATPAGPPGLEQVFREHQQRVFRAAYRVTGNAQDAEDVLQTVFLRLARRDTGELPVENPSSYLYRAAVNTALDLLRARRGAENVAIEDAERQRPTALSVAPERGDEVRELREWLRRALARLTPKAAEVFTLRYVEGHGNHEIARMLGLSRIAVAVSLHRTRRRLSQELKRRGLR